MRAILRNRAAARGRALTVITTGPITYDSEVCTWRTLAALTILASGATAQSDVRAEFGVASIKSPAPNARGRFIRPSPGGRVNVTSMTLKDLIEMA